MRGEARGQYPEDAETAYALWLGVCRRNVAATARRMGLNPHTVQSWSQRYRWRERAHTEDREYTADMVGWAWRELAAMIPYAVRIKRQSMLMPCEGEACNSEGEAPAPLPFDKDRDKSADGVLARFGMSPQKTINLSLSAPVAPASVSDDELDALLAAGDVDALLALASGKPLPLPGGVETVLPGDFTSGQPGGRVVPEPSSPVPPPRKSKPVDHFEGVWKASTSAATAAEQEEAADADGVNDGP